MIAFNYWEEIDKISDDANTRRATYTGADMMRLVELDAMPLNISSIAW